MDYFETDNFLVLKKLKLIQNGNPQKIYTITLKKNINFKQLKQQIIAVMGLNTKNIRIFMKGGVEVEPEEIDYIKSNEMLYISNGEDFDQNSHLAEYKILREVGAGGFGVVYEGKHRLTKERVAIKMSQPKHNNAKEVESMLKEIMALKYLRHRNILRILNCFFMDMKIILILEYLEGGDLKQYVKENGRLSEQECQTFFKQIYSAIYYCHKQNIIHRDLKLENLMLTDRLTKQLKVVDFGISGTSSQVNIDYTEAGSLRYLAPEVIQFRAPAHSGIDIWAMGVILYWMLHGHSPFEGRTKLEILQKIVKADYKIDDYVTNIASKACIDLISKMLQVDVKQRINIYQLGEHIWLKEDCDKILNEEYNLQQIERQELLLKTQIFRSKENDPKQFRRTKNQFALPTLSFLNRFSRYEENIKQELTAKYKRKSLIFENRKPIREFLSDHKR